MPEASALQNPFDQLYGDKSGAPASPGAPQPPAAVAGNPFDALYAGDTAQPTQASAPKQSESANPFDALYGDGKAAPKAQPDEPKWDPNKSFIKNAWDFTDVPLVHWGYEALGVQDPATNPNLPGWGRGIARFVEDFTSPRQLALMAATEGIGNLVSTAAPLLEGLGWGAEKAGLFGKAAEIASTAMKENKPINEALQAAGIADTSIVREGWDALQKAGINVDDLRHGRSLIDRTAGLAFKHIGQFSDTAAFKASRAMSTGLHLYWTVGAITQAAQASARAGDALRDGDWDHFAEYATEAGLSAGLGALGARGTFQQAHSLFEGPRGKFAPTEEVRILRNILGDRAQSKAAAVEMSDKVREELDTVLKNSGLTNEEDRRAVLLHIEAGDTETIVQQHNALMKALGRPGEMLDPGTGRSGGPAPLNPIEAARTKDGKLQLGANIPSLGNILGSSFYAGSTAKVIARELLQNTRDAIRNSPNQDITVGLDYTNRSLSVEDHGPGMTRNQLETVFTDLGDSGKRDQADAAGGFGLAKAAFLLMTKMTKVTTVVQEGGKLVEYSFTSTPKTLINGEVEITERAMPAGTPTGTKVQAYLPEGETLYDAKEYLRGSRLSINAPGKVKIIGDLAGGDDAEPAYVPAKPTWAGRVPGSKVSLYVSPQREFTPLGNLSVEVHNHGIYQFTDRLYNPTGDVKGMPSRVAVNIEANVPEGHRDYPFTANREGLRYEVRDKVMDQIRQQVLAPILDRQRQEIGDLYYNLPEMKVAHPVTGQMLSIPILDSGSRFTPAELKELQQNPALHKVAEAVHSSVRATINHINNSSAKPIDWADFGSNVKRIGLVFSKDVHGVYIQDPNNPKHATVFLNFGNMLADSPKNAASLVSHTIEHELLHTIYKGHNESFTSGHATMAGVQEPEFISKRLEVLKNAFADPESPSQLHPELARALEIYRASRGRAESAPDVLGGEKLRGGRADAEPGQGRDSESLRNRGDEPVRIKSVDELRTKFGTTDDLKRTAFLAPDGSGIPRVGRNHDTMIGAKPGSNERVDFINRTASVRVYHTLGRAGEELHFSLPGSGITTEQAQRIRSAASLVRHGRIIIESAGGRGYEVLDFPTGASINAALDKIGPVHNLTPEEIGQLTRGKERWQRMQEHLAKEPGLREAIAAAQVGAVGRKWYQRSESAFRYLMEMAPDQFKPGDFPVFMDVVASTSPNQSVKQNIQEALNFWKEWNKADRPNDEKGVRKIVKGMARDGLSKDTAAKIPNLAKAVSREGLLSADKDQYFKAGHFAENLRGDAANRPSAVTIDTHMASFFDVAAADIKDAPGYHAIQSKIRDVATDLGWEPKEVQAAIWCFWKTLKETTDGGVRPSALLPYLDDSIIRQYSQDFADLMLHDEDVRGALRRFVKGDLDALDTKLAAIPEATPLQTGTQRDALEIARRSAERLEQQRGGAPAQEGEGQLAFSARAPRVANIPEIVRRHFQQGGSTTNFRQGDLAGKPLYSVGVHPDRTAILPAELTDKELEQKLTDFIHDQNPNHQPKNLELLMRRDRSLGTWQDPATGKHYIDISATVPDREQALRLGREAGQKAIYDLAKREDIQVPYERGPETLQKPAATSKAFTPPANLEKGIDKEDAVKVKIPLSKLTLHKSAMEGAARDIASKRQSRTTGPVEVFYDTAKKQFLVADGQHRVMEAIQRGDKEISAKLWSGYSDTIAPVYREADRYQLPSDETSIEAARVRKPEQRPGIPEDLEALIRAGHLKRNYSKAEIDDVVNAYRRAAKGFTPEQYRAIDAVNDKFANGFDIAKAHGLIENAIEGYFTRRWKPDQDLAPRNRLLNDARAGKFSTNVTMAKHRTLGSTLEGILLGKKLDNWSPSDLAARYTHDVMSAAANRQFLDKLEARGARASDGRPMAALSGVGHVVEGSNGENPAEPLTKKGPAIMVNPGTMRGIRINDKYIESLKQSGLLEKYIDEGKLESIGMDRDGKEMYKWNLHDYVYPNHGAFHDWNWVARSPDGLPVIVKSEMRLHPEVSEYIQNALGIKKQPQGGVKQGVLRVGSEAKHLVLSLSPFHLMQEGLRGLMVGINPFTKAGIRMDEDPTGHLALGYKHGLTGKNPEYQSAFSEGQAAGHSKLLNRVPVVGRIQNWFQDFLFNRYIPGLKSRAFLHEFDKFAKEHPEWSQDRVAASTAEHINNVFGGQNWQMLGRDMATQDWARIFALAPDWLESEGRFARSVFSNESSVARNEVIKMTVGMWGISRILNLLMTQNPHYEAPFGVAYKDRDGREHILGVRTLPTDVFHMASDPVGFLRGRSSPFVKEGVELTTGRDAYGKKIPPGDLAVHALRNVSPIPLEAVRRAKDIGSTAPTNTDQLARAAGLTAVVYKTQAQQLAAEKASNRSESGPIDADKLAEHRAKIYLEDQLRSKHITIAQLHEMYDHGQLSKKDLDEIHKNSVDTKDMDPEMAALYARASRLPMKDFLEIWDAATPKEHLALEKLMMKKRKNYFKSMHERQKDARLTDPVYLRLRSMFPEEPPY